MSARTVRVFRYDPAAGGDGHFDRFVLDIPNETTATMLDVLLRIQREQDPTIAFRFACRVNMCGSCGMVINGKEALACKTNVSDIKPGQDITLRPLNHFPLIKDLVVDMDPLFQKFEQTLQFFEPKEECLEPAILPPDAPERQEMRQATDCIACGCCVSSCTMCHYHEDYAGPAVLNRAYSLLADSRDALFEPRLERALESCYNCRTEVNCTEVCPKQISSTRAIKYIQRLALTHRPMREAEQTDVLTASEPAGMAPAGLLDQLKASIQMDRATFLRQAGIGLLGASSALAIGRPGRHHRPRADPGQGPAALDSRGETQRASAGRDYYGADEVRGQERDIYAAGHDARSGLAARRGNHLLQDLLSASGLPGALGRPVGTVPLFLPRRHL